MRNPTMMRSEAARPRRSVPSPGGTRSRCLNGSPAPGGGPGPRSHTSGLGEAIRRGEGREVLRGPVQVPFDLANRRVERALPRPPRCVARDAVASVGILGLREVGGADSFRHRPDSIPPLPRLMAMLREPLERLPLLPAAVERDVHAE